MPTDRRRTLARRSFIPRLIHILDRFNPDLVLLPDALTGGVHRSNLVRTAIKAVADEATKRDMMVSFVSNEQVKIAFRDGEGRPAKTKTAINRLLATAYPELGACMPKARRPYEPEQHYTPLFHAASMYWGWRDYRETALREDIPVIRQKT